MAEPIQPVRLRLSRAKGFNLQEESRSANGLEAVNVARPTKWGNPYHVDDTNMWWCRHPFGSRERTQGCVDHYERAIREGFVLVPYTWLTPEERGDDYHSSGAHYVHEVAPKYLGGKNLACWCALDAPCHADVLLRLANPIHCEALETSDVR
jgi:hypothetical protein